MNTISTFENYKLINDFLYPGEPLKSWINSENFTDLFIEDWNSLMEVVEKIEGLDYNFSITSKNATVLINHAAIYQTNIYRIDGTKKIQAVYNTCVEFIKWYNDSKN